MAESTPRTRTASYLAEPDEVHRVCLLYSGGLDTSVMLKWIQDEYEAEVVTLTVDLGQPGEDYTVVEGKAKQLGAVETRLIDAREDFARDYVVPAIKANAIYGLGYPLFTALGRPLIAKLAVDVARETGCDTIAHGCTGKGNDQVGIEAGAPVSINGERLGLVELIDRVAELGIKHGIGIVDHVEDRIVGLKVRDIYEVPAAAIILPAHAELERLVGTIHENRFKPMLDQQWAYLVYAGLWYEPLRLHLDAYMNSVNERVTGEIGMKLYKGSVRPVTRSSPNAVYDAQLATFESGGALFSQQASPGFIELWSLQSRLAWRLRQQDGG